MRVNNIVGSENKYHRCISFLLLRQASTLQIHLRRKSDSLVIDSLGISYFLQIIRKKIAFFGVSHIFRCFFFLILLLQGLFVGVEQQWRECSLRLSRRG